MNRSSLGMRRVWRVIACASMLCAALLLGSCEKDMREVDLTIRKSFTAEELIHDVNLVTVTPIPDSELKKNRIRFSGTEVIVEILHGTIPFDRDDTIVKLTLKQIDTKQGVTFQSKDKPIEFSKEGAEYRGQISLTSPDKRTHTYTIVLREREYEFVPPSKVITNLTLEINKTSRVATIIKQNISETVPTKAIPSENIIADVPFGTIPSDDTPLKAIIADIALQDKAQSEQEAGSTITFTKKGETFEGKISVKDREGVPHSYTIVLQESTPPLVSTYVWTETEIQTAGENAYVIGQAIFDDVLKEDDTLFEIKGIVPHKEYEVIGNTAQPSYFTADETGKGKLTKKLVSSVLDTAISDKNLKKDAVALKIYAKGGKNTHTLSLSYRPTEIWSWQDLQAMRYDVAGTYVQKRDIVFPDEDEDGKGDHNFEPIGKSDGTPFRGNFDGGTYTITKLNINRPDDYYAGLFGKAEGKTDAKSSIKAHLKDAQMIAKGPSGVVVGKAVNAIVEGTSHGTLKTTGVFSYAGGLVGWASTSTVIGSSKANVTTDGNGANVGGLVGHADTSSTVIGASSGSVTPSGMSTNAGGLVGMATINSTVIGSSSGTVTTHKAFASAGGLVGLTYTSTVIGSSSGSVSTTGSNAYAGGLVGEAHSSTVRGVYRRGTLPSGITHHVHATREAADAILGKKGTNTTVASYYESSVRVSGSAPSRFGAGITAIASITQNIFSALIFEESGSSTPVHYWTFADGKWPCIDFDAVIRAKAPGVTVKADVLSKIKAAAVCDQ